jgi:uncharacterized protein YjbI with pentapeptide repeats
LIGVSSGGITGTPASLPPGWQLIGGYLIGPNANLTSANLAGLYLGNADLQGAILFAANLSGTNFAGATLTGVRAAGITGTPLNLPPGWIVTVNDLFEHTLVGPGANLTNLFLEVANFTGASLAGANLTKADLGGAILTGVDLTGVVWLHTVCPDGTNSDHDGGTCADNL